MGGKHYLVQDYSLQCTGPGYVATSVFNSMFVVGVVLGWPLWLIYYLRKIALAGKLNVARVDDRIGTSFVAHSLIFVTVCTCVFSLWVIANIHECYHCARMFVDLGRFPLRTVQGTVYLLGCPGHISSVVPGMGPYDHLVSLFLNVNNCISQ